MNLKGVFYAIVAAITYGTNPLGALFLYEEGINTHSVLFYRFTLAAVMLGALMLFQKQSFRVSKRELLVLGILGFLFAGSALSLFSSFHYMEAGVACTILFIYPVMVAVIMAVFFKEKLTLVTVLSIGLALGGIGLLYQTEGGGTLSTIGIILVMISALTYALYIILINKSPLKMSSTKLTFYVLLFCILVISGHSFTEENTRIVLLKTPWEWMWASMLALVPTVISLVTMAMAVKLIGSTPTAILGALEPLTAVFVGVTLFGEVFTFRLAIGILLILLAVILIIMGKSNKRLSLRGKAKSYWSRLGRNIHRHG